MSVRNLILLLALPFLSCNNRRIDAGTISLQYGWKCRTGDDLRWASIAYDDTAWGPIQTGDPTGRSPIFDKYDGYAWCREKIFLPSSMKASIHLRDSLIFF